MSRGIEVLIERLGIGPGDIVSVVTDSGVDPGIGSTLLGAMLDAGADANWSQVQRQDSNGANFPAPIVAALRASDIALLATSWSASHSAGVIDAIQGGVRVVSMPGIRMDMFGDGGMTADYDEVERLSVRWGEHFGRGRRAHLTSRRGTDLRVDLGGWGRRPFLDMGRLPRGEGGLANMPAGEVAIPPIEGTGDGRIVADLMVSSFKGNLTTPVVITIVGGRIVEIDGGPEAQTLRAALDQHGPGAEVVAELALGTNAAARSIGIVLEDEKQLGTAHVGFGHAVGLGGSNESTLHADAILADATLTIDGVPLLRDGQVTPEGFAREPLDLFDGAGGAYDPTEVETRVDPEGRLLAAWQDVADARYWAQVGNDAAARSAARVVGTGVFTAPAETRDAQALELLARYGVVKRHRR